MPGYKYPPSRQAQLDKTEEAGTRARSAPARPGTPQARPTGTPARQAKPKGRAGRRVERKSMKARSKLGLSPKSAAGYRADVRRTPKTGK